MKKNIIFFVFSFLFVINVNANETMFNESLTTNKMRNAFKSLKNDYNVTGTYQRLRLGDKIGPYPYKMFMDMYSVGYYKNVKNDSFKGGLGLVVSNSNESTQYTSSGHKFKAHGTYINPILGYKIDDKTMLTTILGWGAVHGHFYNVAIPSEGVVRYKSQLFMLDLDHLLYKRKNFYSIIDLDYKYYKNNVAPLPFADGSVVASKFLKGGSLAATLKNTFKTNHYMDTDIHFGLEKNVQGNKHRIHNKLGRKAAVIFRSTKGKLLNTALSFEGGMSPLGITTKKVLLQVIYKGK